MVRRARWLRIFERLIQERAEQLPYGVALLLRARPMAAIVVSAMALKISNHSASRGETHLPRSVYMAPAAGGKVIAKNGLRPWIVVSANVVARVFQ